MAAVSQEEFAKAMKSIENKFVETERSTTVREMAHSANLQAVPQEITEYAEGVVDQTAAKFTQLEMQTRLQRELASSIIQAAKVEFETVKQAIDAIVALLISRLDSLESDVKQLKTPDHLSMADTIKNLTARVAVIEAAPGGGSTSGSAAARGYLPEKSMVPNIFNREADGWRIWRATCLIFRTPEILECRGLLEEISQHKELPIQEVLRKMASLGVKGAR